MFSSKNIGANVVFSRLSRIFEAGDETILTKKYSFVRDFGKEK